MDAAPILEASEHDLDLVTPAVERGVMRDRHLTVRLRGDAGGHLPGGKRLAQPVGIIASVGDEEVGLRDRLEHQSGALVVAHLPLAQQHDAWPALVVADGMKLGVQPAFGASDTSGNSPFLSRLAAVRCAFRWVASIINWSGLPPFAANAAKMRLNTPSRLQRTKRAEA